MSGPAHVGESPPPIFHAPAHKGEGAIIANPEHFMVLSDVLFELLIELLPLGDWTAQPDGRLVTMNLRGPDGWVTYRRVGRHPDRKHLVFELVESEYTAW